MIFLFLFDRIDLQPTLVHGIPEHPGHRAGEKPC
jgi:hypothetical protein